MKTKQDQSYLKLMKITENLSTIIEIDYLHKLTYLQSCCFQNDHIFLKI